MTQQIKKSYVAPEVELLIMGVEQGFAASTNFSDPESNNDYADDADFWG